MAYFSAIKLKVLSDHLAKKKEKNKGKKKKKDSNFVVTVLLSIVLDAWLWLRLSSLTLFRST